MSVETLTEGNKYSTTELQKAVIDRLVKDSRVLELLPFEEIVGNSLTYNTITTDATASYYNPGDSWTESTPVLTQAIAALVILGGDADVDNFIMKTRSNKIDLKGTVIANKVKAVQYAYIDSFYYGTGTGTPPATVPEFTGLHGLLTSTTYNLLNNATASVGVAISMAEVRQTIDLITGWKPTHLVMNKTVRRLIGTYLDSIGSAFPRAANDWGKPVEYFDGLEIIVDDHIVNTEATSTATYSAKTGGTNQTSIFILTFDPLAACGVHSGDKVQITPLGELETKDASRWRIKWYCGLKVEDIRSCAIYDGLASATAVTA